MPPALKLNAHDEEDLAVLSAAMQDSLVRVGDMIYLPKRRRFALVGNRFMWEINSADSNPLPEEAQRFKHRIRAGLHFDGVMAVKTQNIVMDRKQAVLDLLTISYESGNDGGGEITLVFAGGGALLLEVECIDAALSDMGAPWVTPNLPDHGADE